MKRIKAVKIVTPAHGETFAREWYELSCRLLDMVDVFEATGIMTWPDEDEEAQDKFHDIEDKIIALAFEAVKPAIAEAFVTTANEVLARERRRRRPVVTS